MTFRELDEDSTLLADGLRTLGARPGMRLVLMVRPGIDFISLVFATFKAGVVAVLIDPGMGRRSLLRCLEEVEPAGFVAIPLVHAFRTVLRHRFPQARCNVTVGGRWFWGGATIADLRRRALSPGFQPAASRADDPAAIIFTTGSTGPPKGVLYRHGNFDAQVAELRDFYQIQPGEIDLPGFPLFALFNCAMGVSTIVPDMDPTRPALADPRRIVAAIQDWQVTQSFGSPALWNVVGRYCETHNVRLPSLRRVFSAGAPVPPHVLRRMRNAIAADGDVHTPYGATECLPVASIAATEVLGETAARSIQGAGTCIGRRFPGLQWKVIRITEGPLATLDQVQELPRGEIGELIVQGRVVTREYVTGQGANPLHKIRDGALIWHRVGDVGYLDEHDRFWFCGRKAHRVLTTAGPMYTIPCEAIFHQHEQVYRSALVGVGPAGSQRPVLVVETWPDRRPRSKVDRQRLVAELLRLAAAHPLTHAIQDVLLHPSLPVDIRHNAKISREKLALWAAGRLA
jgi:acyl-CoA synthetase (AMP-forming)/AMP-acid ligase II